jgi:hypothetical protein
MLSDDDSQLRYVVKNDIAMAIGARRNMSYREFVNSMKKQQGI